jgi:hypothetical protein
MKGQIEDSGNFFWPIYRSLCDTRLCTAGPIQVSRRLLQQATSDARVFITISGCKKKFFALVLFCNYNMAKPLTESKLYCSVCFGHCCASRSGPCHPEECALDDGILSAISSDTGTVLTLGAYLVRRVTELTACGRTHPSMQQGAMAVLVHHTPNLSKNLGICLPPCTYNCIPPVNPKVCTITHAESCYDLYETARHIVHHRVMLIKCSTRICHRL